MRKTTISGATTQKWELSNSIALEPLIISALTLVLATGPVFASARTMYRTRRSLHICSALLEQFGSYKCLQGGSCAASLCTALFPREASQAIHTYHTHIIDRSHVCIAHGFTAGLKLWCSLLHRTCEGFTSADNRVRTRCVRSSVGCSAPSI